MLKGNPQEESMKRVIVLLTVVCFTLSLASLFTACGKDEPVAVAPPVQVKKAIPLPKPVTKKPEAPAVIKKKDSSKKKPIKPTSKPKTLKKKGGSSKKSK